MEALLEKSEVSKLLRISERKIDKDRSQGLLTCVKIGDRVLFEPTEISRYVAEHREKGKH